MAHGLALLWWIGFLALAVATPGTLPTLMTPGMRWTVWATLAVLVVLAVPVLLRRLSVHRHGDDAGWPAAALHAVPLLLLIIVGAGDLGSAAVGAGAVRPRAMPRPSVPAPTVAPAAASTRSATAAMVALPPQGRPAWLPGDETPLTIPPLAAVAPAPAAPLDLMQLHFPERHPGVVRVRTIGRLLDPESQQGRFVDVAAPDRAARATIYRFVMTCCAADAAPVFCRLHDGTIAVANLPVFDSWVEIEGRWIPPKDAEGTPAIAIDRITAVAAPAEPYLQVDVGRSGP